MLGDEAAATRLGLRSAADWEPGAGPLSALAGGLAVCPEGLHALLACDMPFLQADLLRRMAALGGQAQAVVPMVEGRKHPLCSLYQTSCLAPAERLLAQGERRMDALLDEVEVCIIKPEMIAPHNLGHMITNVNTPAEYQQALEAERT